MKLEVLDQHGKRAEEIVVDNAVFGADVNTYLIHAVAVAQANNQRQGTKSTLTRSEVRGHAKKPYRQKGTGNARQGSTKGPQFDGGGVAFAPKPRDFTTKINKKQKTAAFVSAISGKVADKELVVIKDTKLNAAKTKNVVKLIKALKLVDKKALFVTEECDQDFLRAVGNIQTAKVTTAGQLSVLDVVTNKYVVASVASVKAIEKQYIAALSDSDEVKTIAAKTIAKTTVVAKPAVAVAKATVIAKPVAAKKPTTVTKPAASKTTVAVKKAGAK